MIAFWIFAAVMILAALGLIVPPLLGRGRASGETRRELNVAIHRERLAELEADLAEGALSREQYEQTRAELERDLLEDTADAGTGGTRGELGTAGRAVAVVVGIAVPVVAVGIYWGLGSRELLSGIPAQAQQDTQMSVEQMVAGLAQRLQRNPDDGEGWRMLGRSYRVMERFPQAAEAYARAYTILGDEPDLLVEYAEALSLTREGRLLEEPERLIARALERAPRNPKALWLSGVAAYQGARPEQALARWRSLLEVLAPESDNSRLVQGMIARVEAEMAGTAPPPVAPPAAAASGAAVIVRVEIAESLRSKVRPEDTVYVFARAPSGPPAPLAVRRMRAGDLPAVVTLDDSLAMVPSRRVSMFESVLVGARVSKSGGATAQTGDLQGSLPAVPVGGEGPARLLIDQEVL